jgi:hypothetical protein
MGERVDKSNMSMSSNSKQNSAIAGKKMYQKQLVASRPKGFAQRYCEPLVSLRHSDFGNSALGRTTFFLLKVAALEAVRRFSKSRCPCVWRGLQGLQFLVYPPFRGIQRWATFRGLVKSMQVCDYQFNRVSIHIYVYIKGHFKAEKYVMSGKPFAMKLNYFGVASFKNL